MLLQVSLGYIVMSVSCDYVIIDQGGIRKVNFGKTL